MLFYEILQFIMDEKGLSIPEVARLSGLPDSTVRSIISRKNKSVALEVAFKLSKGLDIPIERLNGEETKRPLNNADDARDIGLTFTLLEKEHIKKYRKLDTYGKNIIDSVLSLELERLEELRKTMTEKDTLDKPVPEKICKIPLFDLPVSAGRGEILTDDMTFRTITMDENVVPLGTAYAVVVSGDSMEPEYHDGDILLVEDVCSLDKGSLGIFILNGEGYFKELGDNCLTSYNDKYVDIPVCEFDSFYVKGKVLGKA